MMWQAHEGMGWWMVFGGILWILFWAAVVGLLIWGIARVAGHDHHRTRKDNSIDIARDRYAKGEITKEQFDQLKKDLT